MIVVSSVNGRNVDNAEGLFKREVVKKLEAERQGIPDLVAGPAADETAEELVPSDEIPEGNDISFAPSKTE